MNAQQRLHCKRLLASTDRLGRVRLSQCSKSTPGNNPFHRVEKLAATCALCCDVQAQATLIHGCIVWAVAASMHTDGRFVQTFPGTKTLQQGDFTGRLLLHSSNTFLSSINSASSRYFALASASPALSIFIFEGIAMMKLFNNNS